MSLTLLLWAFQSTRPVRGGTPPHAACLRYKKISIHPPRAGRDMHRDTRSTGQKNFNPPAPCGAGQAEQPQTILLSNISIHPPRAGRDDRKFELVLYPDSISIHPPRAGRDGARGCAQYRRRIISIHPPRAGRDCQIYIAACSTSDFNPPAPCGAGRRPVCSPRPAGRISIHPPRAGRDFKL